MKPILSILVTSIHSRKDLLERLTNKIKAQLVDGVEYLVSVDGGETSIGLKREQLKQKAEGKYIAYVDDDDLISRNYVRNILGAAQDNPDAIGITGIYTHNLANRRKFICSSRYDNWDFSIPKHIVRSINHINPVKRELALQAPFPNISYGEDRFYSAALKPLIKTETMAKGFLYWYDYRPLRSESIQADIRDNNRGANMVYVYFNV